MDIQTKARIFVFLVAVIALCVAAYFNIKTARILKRLEEREKEYERSVSAQDRP